ncbi:MAG: ABC transporter permease [Clostridiales bacterium]|nr:ABC transporter permease [Clostridiales bacterium]
MNLFQMSLKNTSFKNKKLIITIILLTIGLSVFSVVKYISANLISMVEKEYKDIEDNNFIKVTTLQHRNIGGDEIEYILNMDDVENVVLDYNLALMLADENEKIIYQAKVQEYDESLGFSFVEDKIEDSINGIVLPDIFIKDSPNPTDFKQLMGKTVNFMLEIENEDGGVHIEPYPLEVIGIYETKLDQNTASLFVINSVLEDIQNLMQLGSNVYGFDVIINPDSNIDDVSSKIEQLGLDTVYRQKSLRSSLKNVDSQTKIIKIASYILMLLGIIVLLLFVMERVNKRTKEIAVLKVIGYSSLFASTSVFIELIFYMLFSSAFATVLFKMAVDIVIRMVRIIPLLAIRWFSFEMAEMFIRNATASVGICLVLYVCLYIRIRNINPLDQLKEVKGINI